MPIVKEQIKDCVMKAAEELFLENVFVKVSMRDISIRSGVGLGNIYNYFKGKDEIFRLIVRPAMNDLEALLHEHHGHSGMDIMAMTDETYLRRMVNEYVCFLNRHRRRLAVLLTKANGSSLENYREDFTRRATALVREYFNNMKSKHPEMCSDVSDLSLRMHTIWIFAMFEELITCEISKAEMKKVVTEYLTIEVAGWRELMKI